MKLPGCLPTRSTAISQVSLKAQRYSHLVTFTWWRVNQPMNRVSAPGAPSIDRLEVLIQSPLITTSKFCPNLLDHGLQVHLQTCSITDPKCICRLAQLLPARSHNHGLQLHLQTRLITACKCKSPNWLQYGLQTRSKMASKFASS